MHLRHIDTLGRTDRLSVLLVAAALAALLTSPACGVAADDEPSADVTDRDDDGVAPEQRDVAALAQPLVDQCSILRPYGWSSSVASCAESQNAPSPLILAPGESVTLYSAPYVGFGRGRVTLECGANGDWVETERRCLRNPGGGQEP
jgi:hypothetical protein